jgi:uncharacterized membrane protein
MEKMTFKLYKYILFAMGFVVAQLTITIVTFTQQLTQYAGSYTPQQIAQVVETYFRMYVSPMAISVAVLLAISVIAYFIEFRLTKAYRQKKLRKSELLTEKFQLEKPQIA